MHWLNPPSPTTSPASHSTDVDPTEARYCARCRRALTTHTGATGVTFLHAIELRGQHVDHHAKPVPVTQIPDPLIECDFCSAPTATWALRCGPHETDVRRITRQTVATRDYREQHHAARVRHTDTEHAYTHNWGAQWSACDGCTSLVDARDLLGLLRRVVESMPAKFQRGRRLIEIRGQLHDLYADMFATLLPGKGRILPGYPLGHWTDQPPTST